MEKSKNSTKTKRLTVEEVEIIQEAWTQLIFGYQKFPPWMIPYNILLELAGEIHINNIKNTIIFFYVNGIKEFHVLNYLKQILIKLKKFNFTEWKQLNMDLMDFWEALGNNNFEEIDKENTNYIIIPEKFLNKETILKREKIINRIKDKTKNNCILAEIKYLF